MRCKYIHIRVCVESVLVGERGAWFPVEEVKSSWCDCDCLSLTANRRREELMELSTTNGHLTIDYLFIYQPPFVFLWWCIQPFCIALLYCTVNNLFLQWSEDRASNGWLFLIPPCRRCDSCFEDLCLASWKNFPCWCIIYSPLGQFERDGCGHCYS